MSGTVGLWGCTQLHSLYTLWAVSVTGLGQEQVEVDVMFGVQVVESKCGMETESSLGEELSRRW